MRRRLVWGAVVAVLAARVIRARHQRFMHPAGRSFAGTLEISGAVTGSQLLDRPGRHPVTVRVSRGVGLPAALPDILGLAMRVAGPGGRRDLLLSTAGRSRLSRHVPVPRWTFDTGYGSILSYRTGGPPARKVYLSAVPDPGGRPLGRTLDAVVSAASGGVTLLLMADGMPVGRLSFGTPLPAADDAALAFDPVRNSGTDLHPTGLIQASRAWAYRAAQRWRGAYPAAADEGAVLRTAAHR
jgi:hypothetical protein